MPPCPFEQSASPIVSSSAVSGCNQHKIARTSFTSVPCSISGGPIPHVFAVLAASSLTAGNGCSASGSADFGGLSGRSFESAMPRLSTGCSWIGDPLRHDRTMGFGRYAMALETARRFNLGGMMDVVGRFQV
jgi:hypothetical protein